MELLETSFVQAGGQGFEPPHLYPILPNSKGSSPDRWLGANSHVRKPYDFTEFFDVARQLGLYWLVVNVPPSVQRKS
jgi:hypothetical protein